MTNQLGFDLRLEKSTLPAPQVVRFGDSPQQWAERQYALDRKRPTPTENDLPLVEIPIPLLHIGFPCEYCGGWPCAGGPKLARTQRATRIVCKVHGGARSREESIPWLPKLERNFVGRELQWTAVPVFEERPHGELVFSQHPRTGETLVRRRRWSQA